MTSFAFGASISVSIAPALFISFLLLSSLEGRHWVLPCPPPALMVALHHLVQGFEGN